jgi:hypothetical protein
VVLTIVLLPSKSRIFETRRKGGSGGRRRSGNGFFCNPDPEIAEGEGTL